MDAAPEQRMRFKQVLKCGKKHWKVGEMVTVVPARHVPNAFNCRSESGEEVLAVPKYFLEVCKP